MLKRHTQIFSSVLRLLDMSLAFTAWELAYQLRFHLINLPPATMIPPHDEYLKAALFVAILTGFVFSFSGVYRLHKVIHLRHEFVHLLRGTASLLLLTLVAAFFYREFSFSRVHSLYFLTCILLLLFLSRVLSRWSLQWLHARGAHVEHVLLIGSGVSANKFFQRLERLKSLGIVLKGVIEISSKPNSDIPADIPRLGGIELLTQTIQTQQIDQVFIALAPEEQHKLPELKELLAEQWVDVRIIPDLGSFRTLHTEVETFDDMPIITIIQSPMTGWNQVFKRLLDIFGSLFALVIFSPLMFLIALLIKLTSSGPVFYAQERMGLDGLTFKALKFRSMRIDAESQTGAVWASENDNRRTKLGVFLRKYSLDELPQLFNVIKGEMSLVGPRPERPVFIEQFKSQIPHYMLRHKVKAGITGWAQINGWRGNTSLEKRIECDLYYIERWTLWFDVKILILTLFRGIIDPNAY
ncbi:MAG: undecaprenyl-phosphate glucose phosphotransferase [SAR324 cluster bacterium]|nr:undecaprenyl-phosphate glucose phosphotransferase [SAR324 cluster bacterium]MBL7035937.1 undecaprenyl-phosphate glucose phosphotransferase [SAR324 cluster bacterium]